MPKLRERKGESESAFKREQAGVREYVFVCLIMCNRERIACA